MSDKHDMSSSSWDADTGKCLNPLMLHAWHMGLRQGNQDEDMETALAAELVLQSEDDGRTQQASQALLLAGCVSQSCYGAAAQVEAPDGAWQCSCPAMNALRRTCLCTS